MEPMTFDFNVSLDDLLYTPGLEGLNEILDNRLEQDPSFEGVIATDISYETVSATPGPSGTITIRAIFTPEDL